jgi:hypothetical protein
LIEKRLRFPIDYSPFGDTSTEAVWKKLYELRSRIAHGAFVDFTGALAVLDDAYTVEVFLRQTIRRFLRGAIEEPVLFVDLKDV